MPKPAPRSNPWILAILLRAVRTYLLSEKHNLKQFAALLNEREVSRLRENQAGNKLEKVLKDDAVRRMLITAQREDILKADFAPALGAVVSKLSALTLDTHMEVHEDISKLLRQLERAEPKINKKFKRQSTWRAFYAMKAALIEALPEHFTKTKIGEFETNRRVINYRELQIYSSMVDLPLGIMMSVSRLTAEIRDGPNKGLHGLDPIVAGLQSLCSALRDPANLHLLRRLSFVRQDDHQGLHPYDEVALAALFKSLIAAYRQESDPFAALR